MLRDGITMCPSSVNSSSWAAAPKNAASWNTWAPERHIDQPVAVSARASSITTRK